MKLAIMILTSLALASAGLSQERAPSDGLLLDHTSPEAAIMLLGSPREDRLNTLSVQKIDNWLSSARKQKQFRVLTFESVKGFERIELSFLNDKLVMLHYKLAQKLAAKDLRQIYRLPFFPIFSEFDIDRGPTYYEQYRGTVEVVRFPETYYLVGVSSNSLVSARVFNRETDPPLPGGGIIRRRYNPTGSAQTGSALVGNVTDIQIVSRTLERKSR